MLSRNLLFGLGILALLAGGLLAILWFRRPDTPPATATAQIQIRTVLVAARPIPAGALLRAADMKWGQAAAPKAIGDEIVSGSLNDADLIGAAAKRAFAKGDPLTLIALAKPEDRDFLVAALRPGYRAISIAVDATQSTSGLASPGDYVDVLLTQSFAVQGTDAGHKSVGETILRNLRVIAVDQLLAPVPKQNSASAVLGDIKMPKTLTVQVSERQAATLLVAEQLGKIDFALRGQQGLDESLAIESDQSSPIWASDVSHALTTPSPGKSDTGHGAINVIRGGKIERLCPTSSGLLLCP